MAKKLILWVMLFLSTFVCFVAAFYFGKGIFMPTPSEIPEPTNPKKVSVVDSTSLARIDSLMLVTDELLKQLSDYVAKTQELEQTVSSQEIQIQELTVKNDSLLKFIEKMKIHSDRIQDLTKTLGSMKTEVLRPILQKLPDEIIQILYVKSKTKDKQKIFSALAPERAGRLLKDMTKALLENP